MVTGSGKRNPVQNTHESICITGYVTSDATPTPVLVPTPVIARQYTKSLLQLCSFRNPTELMWKLEPVKMSAKHSQNTLRKHQLKPSREKQHYDKECHDNRLVDTNTTHSSYCRKTYVYSRSKCSAQVPQKFSGLSSNCFSSSISTSKIS